MASSVTYDIYDAAGKLLQANVCVERVGDLLGLYPEEVQWAVEEFGLCDIEAYVAVGHGEAFPG